MTFAVTNRNRPKRRRLLDVNFPGFRTMCLAACVAFPAIAVAEDENCTYVPAILSLTDTVLTQREGLGRFQARNYGDQAAYLKLRYAPGAVADAEGLLRSLIEAKVRTADDLALAWFISTLGVDKALAALDAEIAERPSRLFAISAMRAMVLAGAGELLVERIAAEREDLQDTIVHNLVTAVIDQPDALKQELASIADAHDLPVLAAGFVASQQDPKAWKQYIAGITNPVQVERVTRPWSIIPSVMGNPDLPRPYVVVTEQNALASVRFHRILIALGQQGEREFLNSFLNMTGLVNESYAAAVELLAATESGVIDPKGTLDAGWLLTYRALVALIGEEKVHTHLEVLAAERYQRPHVIDVLDWIIAVEALQPYLKGETDTLPETPEGVSETFASGWSVWTELAEKVKSDPAAAELGSEEATLPIVAELLFAAGKMDALAAVLAAALPSEASVATADDFAKRLDRACMAYFWHPAESLLLAGSPIYKFDPAQ